MEPERDVPAGGHQFRYALPGYERPADSLGGRVAQAARGAVRAHGGGTVRIGGRVPWGAEVEYAYTTGYDSRGRLSMNHIVDERGCGAMLNKPDAARA